MGDLRLEEVMTENPVTIRHDQSVGEALVLMFERDIRHLPVLRDGRLAGMVSDRDIRQLLGRMQLSAEERRSEERYLHLAVSEVMSKTPISARCGTPVRKAIRTMIDHKFGALPVLDQEEKVVGIFTEWDALKYCLALAERYEEERVR
jgi:acetoin utilization protein AcuB